MEEAEFEALQAAKGAGSGNQRKGSQSGGKPSKTAPVGVPYLDMPVALADKGVQFNGRKYTRLYEPKVLDGAGCSAKVFEALRKEWKVQKMDQSLSESAQPAESLNTHP